VQAENDRPSSRIEVADRQVTAVIVPQIHAVELGGRTWGDSEIPCSVLEPYIHAGFTVELAKRGEGSSCLRLTRARPEKQAQAER
jgi:hypothetical protein